MALTIDCLSMSQLSRLGSFPHSVSKNAFPQNSVKLNGGRFFNTERCSPARAISNRLVIGAVSRGRGRGRGRGRARSPPKLTPSDDEKDLTGISPYSPGNNDGSSTSSALTSDIQSDVERLRQELERSLLQKSTAEQENGSTSSYSLTEASVLAELNRLEDRVQGAEKRAELAKLQMLRLNSKLFELQQVVKRGSLPTAIRQLKEVIQSSNTAVRELSLQSEVAAGIQGAKPVIILKYVTAWTTAFIHFRTPSQGWTVAPGVPMADGIIRGSESTEMLPVKIATVNEETVEFVLTNGSGAWDKAPSGGNYLISSGGTYLLKDGSLTDVTE